MNDELMELPEGWEWTTAVEVCSKVIDCHNKTAPYTTSGIKLVRTSNIRNGLINLDDTKFVDQPTYEFWSRRCPPEPGDILFTREAPMAEVGMIPGEEKLCMGQRIMLLRSDNENFSGKYLLYALQAPFIYNYADRVAVGTGVKHLRVKDVEQLPIPLPPLNEQKRIVDTIAQLRERSQKARSALSAIPELCNKFRQSVLAAAFRGDLTADWREQNPDVEPASVLLERIRRDRRKQWEESELSKILSNRKAHTDEKWKLKYKEPIRLDDSELPELPNGWIWTSVEEFADVGTGATPLRSELKYYENGSIPWVTSGALNSLFVRQTEEYITSVAIKETNAKLFPIHTLLIAMYGEGKTRGKVSELLIEAATNQACAALVMNGVSSSIRPTVKKIFQKNYIDIRRLASGGVQPNLNLSMIKNTVVPLPPLKEQAEIVQVVARCMSIVNNIEKQYQESENKLDYFNRSILAKAFRGELVEQDPNDEPASVLLDRIRTEREQQAQEKAEKPGKRGQGKKKAESP